jgi:hypothetical protein
MVALLSAAPLGAQAAIQGTDIDAAADSGRQRSPVFFGGAYTLPKGARGISFQYGMSKERERGNHSVFGETSYEREHLGSSISAYWGVRDWLTLGGSLETSALMSEFYAIDGGLDPATGRSYSHSGTSFGRGDIRAFGRARLYRSVSGATQMALNASVSTLSTQLGLNGSRSAASVGLAFAQQAGPLSLHLAPSYEARHNGGSFAQIAGAIVFPLLPRVTGSIEGVAASRRNGDWNRATTGPLGEVGGALRFDLGRVKLDLGLRHSVGPASGPESASRARIVLGTHVKF